MRGFHVDKLNYDPEDAKFDDPQRKPLPVEEERADRVLVNGARLYNDHGHPEYATPECASLLDLVTHDKAGERIVLGRRPGPHGRGQDGPCGDLQETTPTSTAHLMGPMRVI